MGRVGLFRSEWTAIAALIAGSVICGVAAPGCGAATGISDEIGSTAQGGASGKGGAVATGNCGNGVIDPGESCDGKDLGGWTCASATMGQSPRGVPRCSETCQVLVDSCSPDVGAGGFGAGGFGAGGFGAGGFGAGGFGAGGFGAGGPDGGSLAEACYAIDGVPDPTIAGLCNVGAAAVNACISHAEPTIGGPLSAGCGYDCACNQCPSAYDRCLATLGCPDVFRCAASCAGVVASCLDDCISDVQSYDGESGALTQTVKATFSCLNTTGCQLTCETPL